MNTYDEQAWPDVAADDLWVFDKLIVSRKLNHICGPAGVSVPSKGNYVVRPCVNLLGMSRGAAIQWLEYNTEDIPLGYFWQEVFIGRHLSVDYVNGIQVRCTEGFPSSEDMSKFTRWTITKDTPTIPTPIQEIIARYPNVNVEMIDGHVIELHLRGNPDFSDGAVDIIPIWKDSDVLCPNGFVYVEAPDGDRLGFYKKYY